MKTTKMLIGLFLLFLGLNLNMACSTFSPERKEIVEWAYQIADLEKRLENTMISYQPLIEKISSRPPTNEEIEQLYEYHDQLVAIYNDALELHVPQEASSIHPLFVESYAKTSDSARYYIFAIKENDISYFDKSVLAAQKANSVGYDAFSAFENLLEKYAISCSEIYFCE